MDQLVVRQGESLVEIERKGGKILSENKFFSDLCSLMKNVEFLKFYDEYLKDWSDIQCMIFYMKLYTTIDYEYTSRFNSKISDEAMTYTIKQIMENRDTRRFAFDLFKDFKDISHKNTGSFRTLLNFDDKTQKKKKRRLKKIKALEQLLENDNEKKLIVENEKITISTSIMSKTSNKSPLRYPGGKTRACKILESIMKENFDISNFDTLISPFFGGGSFEFHLQNNHNLNIIGNDKFTPLYNFWVTCKNNKLDLCNELTKKIGLITKDEFTSLRNKIMDENNQLNQSIMYFIINRCSFSGATLSGGFSLEASKKRFTTSSIERIKKLDLKNFNICNLDFEEFINNNENEKNLLFLDPPYYLEKSTLYGNNGDMHESFDHDKLYKCLSTKSNWFMTYNNCDYIKNLYKDFKIIETSWSYGMNKSKKSSEIVIIG